MKDGGGGGLYMQARENEGKLSIVLFFGLDYFFMFSLKHPRDYL